jgi:predicted alpha/beta-fold hydrolase
MILLPGVTGHSASPYLTHVIDEATRSGWRVVTMIYPGFDGEAITSPRFMRVQDPSDLRTVVDHIHANNPTSKIVVFGWSMGACLLVKYLGTVGKDTPVSCGISACNPWCPFEARTVVAEKLHRRLLYNIHFRQAMVENFSNNFDIFKQHLPHIERDHMSKVRVLQCSAVGVKLLINVSYSYFFAS